MTKKLIHLRAINFVNFFNNFVSYDKFKRALIYVEITWLKKLHHGVI